MEKIKAVFLINGKEPPGIRLVNFNTGAVQITNTFFVAKNSYSPVMLESVTGLRPLTLIIEARGSNRNDTALIMSDLSTIISDKSEIYLPDGFWYTAVLESFSEPEIVLDNLIRITAVFRAVRHGPEKAIDITQTTNVYCAGNLPSECVIEFTPTTAMALFEVFGVTLHNLKAGQKVVIDSRKTTVKQNGINIWKDTDIISWPRLQPGKNNVQLSKSMPVKISYYPIYR